MASKLTRKQRMAVKSIIAIHLAVLCLYNTWASLEGWNRLDVSEHATSVGERIRMAVAEASSVTPILWYAKLTGLNTGYAFFAPQVGSFYYYEATCIDDAEMATYTAHHPPLSGTAGFLRYQNFLELFQVLLDETPHDALDKRYARAVAKNMAIHLMAGKSCQRVGIRIGVYHTRPLAAPTMVSSTSLLTLYTDTITTHKQP